LIQGVLFIHILAASAWIGGAILLFGIGVYFKEKAIQNIIYFHIGPFYGYFQTLVLTILLTSGATLLYLYGLHNSITTLPSIFYQKMTLVAIITLSTIIHMIVSLKAHGRERTKMEKIISRGSSLLIFILNLFILWVAMGIRDIL